MQITMNDGNILSIAQLQAFLSGVGAISFNINRRGNENKQAMYDWVGNLLAQVRYFSSSKKERSIVIKYLRSITGLSQGHIKKLIRKKKRLGKLLLSAVRKNTFPTRYTTGDIARLIATDNAHGRLSGPATQRILQREYWEFGRVEFERISHLSVSHLYNLRKSKRQYLSQILFLEKTRAVDRNIGERRKPQTAGKPGFLRVDSVHQGDWDKEKGVYHINLVDGETQWEIIGGVEGIAEYFLAPLLQELLDRFPFVILGFHSDNGSEYINYVVAELLKKLLIDQTKSRSRRTNDNALVEGKNGAVIRKHMGHAYIHKKYAGEINLFYRENLDDYLNFHRPCGFATDQTNDQGKITKVYDHYLTPYEKLKTIPDWEKYLRPSITKEKLESESKKLSDNQSAEKMQVAKSKLFAKFTR